MALLAALHLPSRAGPTAQVVAEVVIGLGVFALIAGTARSKLILSRIRKPESPLLRRVLVLGRAAEAAPYLNLLRKTAAFVQMLPFSSAVGDAEPSHDHKLPASQKTFEEVLKDQIVDEVVVVAGSADISKIQNIAMSCVERGITFRTLVKMPPASFGRYDARVIDRGSYLLSLETTPNSRPLLFVKRILDIAGALVGLIFCGIAYLLHGRRIRRESSGSAFFKQRRVGQNGRPFTLWKFRTMYSDAEQHLPHLLARNEMRGFVFKMRDDPRVTAVGRVLRRRHLDELPQFWNVLKGEMSLVGTRPPTPQEVAHYQPHHHRRLSMKPGITGLWQLRGNSAVNDFEGIVRLDCQYIDHWSLLLDCKILAKTLMTVLKANGW